MNDSFDISKSPDTNFSITCAISKAWLNKTQLPGFSNAQAQSYSFITSQFPTEELVTHILSGGSFTHAAFSEQRRKTDLFVSSQMIVLDFDSGISVAQLKALSFVRNHAWLIYSTPSSTLKNPRTRIIFILDQCVPDVKQWRKYARGLYEFFNRLFSDVPNLNIDLASYSPAHKWAGSTNRVEQPYINHAARLPIDLIPEYVEPKSRTRNMGAGELSNDILKAIEQKLGINRYKSDGWSAPVSCPFKNHEHDGVSPAGAWHNVKHIFYCHKCQKQWRARDTAEILGIDWPKPPSRLKRSGQHRAHKEQEILELDEVATLAPFTADRTFNTRFVSDATASVLKADCIALKSPTGSGKSKWAVEAVKDAPSLLTIAFRQSLVRTQANEYGTTVYDELDGHNSFLIPHTNRISTTIDSLHKFSNQTFHTIVIDEWNSFKDHLSSAGTLKEKAPMTWEQFKSLISRASRIIVMDAHLSDSGLAELDAIRGDIIRIENTYVQPKVPTQIMPKPLAFYSKLLERVEAGTLPILAGVTSPAEARLTKQVIEQLYPEKRVRVITSKQSHLHETQAFIRQINTNLPEVDVLIFNSAMSTGVSIDTPVDSIICLINRPLSPADGVQMLGRARNPQMRLANVPLSVGESNNNADEIFQSLEFAANLTGIETTKQVRSLARLRARNEAQRNLEMASFLTTFRAYCHQDGSNTQAIRVPNDKSLERQLKNIRASHKLQKRADALDTEQVLTITPEMLEKIRKDGTQEITPEIDAGHLRYKIETVTAQPINGHLYDRYSAKTARAALNRADISTSPQTLEVDRSENDENLPLHQRSNATPTQELLYEGLDVLGVKQFTELAAKINGHTGDFFADFALWANKNEKRFETLLGYRSGHDGDLNDPVKALRYFLKRFGLTLIRKQVMKKGERFMIYGVDPKEIAEQDAIIALRRQKADSEGVTTKRQYMISMPFRSNSEKISLNSESHTSDKGLVTEMSFAQTDSC